MGKGKRKKMTGEIVLQYMENPLYRDLPNKTLAELIYNANKEMFTTKDSVRSIVRYYRGQTGDANRSRVEGRVDIKEKGHFAMLNGVSNPFGLPESDEVDWPPFVIASGIRKLLVLSDMHFPYHNMSAVTAALSHGKKEGVDGVLLNGDTLDFYMLSRFEKDARKRSFSDELEMGREFIKILRREFDGCPIYFKLGNHEVRYESFMRTKAPELLSVPDFQIDKLLRFGESGVQLIQDDRIIKAGKLSILHGHEFGRSIFSPVNPARGAYMRSKENILIGHHHQTSSHMEKSLGGEIVGAWSTGCLCEMYPSYLRVNKWNHGFAIINIEADGSFEVNNHTIINGSVR